ncbi:MATE family efflux transporter [Sansalvadorimonas sp. 2012CJ34-2]|uniref:Multidrug export protein MepA n=1 Tax=Parendozoicomonas callyspongiae TaxID=2942213 RepID=A0ABT0PIM1_9GAMM|nr:MATE family efflux transporter [Sansalvadorimonas sp. 2012CJ34-2]MCL6271200.1 MATE family efflux transporter [Sansalvadorimonas sp. 2012CJ34-2]
MSEATGIQDNSQNMMANLPVGKLFWKYTLPAVMGMVVNGLYSVIDGIFIGQAVGAEGLAAINLSWPIFGVLFGFGLMAGTGASALYSINRGAGDTEKARKVMGNVFVLLPIISFALGAVLYVLAGDLLMLQKASGPALSMGIDYLHTLSFGALPALAGMALPMLVRNDEKPKLATALMCFGAVVNIFLDWIFVVMLDQKVQGAALATVMAQGLVMIIGSSYFFSRHATSPLKLSDLRFSLKLSEKTMAVGFSSFVMFLYFSIVMILHNRLFLEYGNVTVLAAYAIVGYVQAFYYMFAEGVGHGIQPIVSFNKGANNNRNIRDALVMAASWAIGIGVTTQLLLNLFPELLASIFINNDPALLESTVLGLRLHLFTMFLDGFIVVCAAYFQALALARLATLISIGNMLIQIPMLLILPKWLGTTGVWISMPISNIFLVIVVLYFVIRDLKQRKAQTNIKAQEVIKKAA